MEREYCVYMHTSPNGKRYVGITCRDPEKRWYKGLGYVGNEHFYRAIKKYGWSNFEHVILEKGLSREQASLTEKELIKKYKSNDEKYGYNIAEGGFGGGHPTSEETKKKISEANKGRPCPEHQKHTLSELNKGKIPTNLASNHQKRQKRVDQFDAEWNYIASFPSIRIAGKECGLPENSIRLCCIGTYKTSGGYKWRFSDMRNGENETGGAA